MTSSCKTYVVEHMEEGFSDWVKLEYKTIQKELSEAGSNFYLTSLSPDLIENVPSELKNIKCTETEVINLDIGGKKIDPSRVCLLDPSADIPMNPDDGINFDVFVFGGILDRTAELRKYGFTGRNLEKVQMTTDTAVRVTKMVVQDRKHLSDIPFVDFPELKFGKHERVEMPFRYVKNSNGDPIMPQGMKELIRKDSEKSLDDLF